jgi:hypothetical protein
MELTPALHRDALPRGRRMHQELDVPVLTSMLRLAVVDEQSLGLGTRELPLPVKEPPEKAPTEAKKVPIEPGR